MEDCYARLISMATRGESDDAIARATGWPEDAVKTIREELQCADTVHEEE